MHFISDEYQQEYGQDREWLRRDFQEIEDRLNWAIQLLAAPGAPEHLLELANDSVRRVNAARETVLRITEKLPSADSGNGAQLVLMATSSLSTAEADLAALQAAVEEEDEADAGQEDDDGTGNGGSTSALDTVRNVLKGAKGVFTKLSRRLVKMISGLLTPREWKLGGEVSGGIPTLGLGTVTIEITFGP